MEQMDELFANPGKKIKNIAKILYLIYMTFVALGMLVYLYFCIVDGIFMILLLPFLLIPVVLLGYLMVLPVYAVGELIDSAERAALASETAANRLCAMTESLPQPVQQPVPTQQPEPVAHSAPAQQPAHVRQPAPAPQPVPTPQPVSAPQPVPKPQPAPPISSNASAMQEAIDRAEARAVKKERKKTLLDIPANERTIRQILTYALQFSSDDGLRNQLVFQMQSDITPENKAICSELLQQPTGQLRAAVQKYLAGLDV